MPGFGVVKRPGRTAAPPSPTGLTVNPLTGLTGTAAGHASWSNFAGGGLGIGTTPVATWTGNTGGVKAPAASGSSGTFTNTAAPEPNAQKYLDDFYARYKQLASTEKEPNTVDTKRLVTTSNARIADQAAGAAEAGKIRAAQLGRGAEGSSFFADKVAERSQRAQASNAANIELEQQRAQDARDDRRRSEANAFFLGGQGAAAMPAHLANAALGLGINQAQTQASVNSQNDTFNEDIAQFLAISNLFPKSGTTMAGATGGVRPPSPVRAPIRYL